MHVLSFLLFLQVAEYYQFVVLVLESNPPVTKKHKDWMKLLQIKINYYSAIAHVRLTCTQLCFSQLSSFSSSYSFYIHQLYQANSLEEQGNYGFMVSTTHTHPLTPTHTPTRTYIHTHKHTYVPIVVVISIHYTLTDSCCHRLRFSRYRCRSSPQLVKFLKACPTL